MGIRPDIEDADLSGGLGLGEDLPPPALEAGRLGGTGEEAFWLRWFGMDDLLVKCIF